MSIGWDVLPLLPLRCVMEHLSTEDALAAMSACQHWRSAMLLYEGRKETLKLQAKQLEKSMFLARHFRKYTTRLHVYLDCSEEELQKFMAYVLQQFFDSVNLHEVLFIGPSYVQQNIRAPTVKLNRIITESLVFKHLQSIQKLALLGCEMDAAKNNNEIYTHKHVAHYSRALSFNSDLAPADAVLSSSNAKHMVFSTLQHIMVDYAQLSTEALQTLSHLAMFAHLTVNVCNKQQLTLPRVDWRRLQPSYPNGLEVSVNIIALPRRKFNKVIQNVLVDGLALTSLKVMFCKTFYTPLITHVVRTHKDTLRELVWADCPSDSGNRVVRPQRQTGYDTCNVNPFILLCWQCAQLRRLVIHGYWIWQYDLLGCVRLRKTLEQLEVSAFYNKQDRLSGAFQPCSDNVVRVLTCDNMKPTNPEYVQQVNDYTEFEWKPTPWRKLHPGLRAGSTAPQRADYIVEETRQPYGVTLYSV